MRGPTVRHAGRHGPVTALARVDLRTDIGLMGIFVIGIVAFAFDPPMRAIEQHLVPWKTRDDACGRTPRVPSLRPSHFTRCRATRMMHVKALRAKDSQSHVHACRCGGRHFGGLDTVKKFPIHPSNPERICWGCDKYCQASGLACSAERTLHPAELFGDDWQEWAPGHVPMTGIGHEAAASTIDAPCDPANGPSARHPT